MSEETRTLSSLLSSVLLLNVSDRASDCYVEDDIAQILANYECPEDRVKNSEGDCESCELHSYVDSELSMRFQLSNTDHNFEIDAVDQWSELFKEHWNSIEYAVTLQIIISLTGISLLNKMNLRKIKNLKFNLSKRLNPENDQDLNPYVKSRLNELYYQVLAVDCQPSDLLRLYKQFNDISTFYLLNSLAAQISDPLSQNYFQFENTYKNCRPQTNELQCSLQFFMEFNNITSNRIATIGKNVYLEIKEGLFCISNDEFIIGLFEDFEFEPATFYSLTLTINGNVLSLFIDGNQISTLSLLENSINSTNHIDLGSMICSFKLFRFTIYDSVLSEESIKTLFALGSTFKESFDRDLDLHGLRATLGDEFLERLGKSLSPTIVSIERISRQIEQLKGQHILIDLDPSKESGMVILDESSRLVRIRSKGIEDPLDDLGVGKCFYYKGANLISMFTSVNCFRLIFCSLQGCKNMDELYNFLSHLMTLLRNDSLRSWFEKEFGFALLSHILVMKVIKKLGKSLPIQFLNLFQEYCGWDFSNISNSLIGDEVAYQNLVLNFDLWYCDSSTDEESFGGVEIIRYLFFQISSLLGGSDYQKLNSQKLAGLNLLEKLCYFQHFFSEKHGYPNVFQELQGDLTNVYLSLLQDNLTKASAQWLLQFSYFELKSGLFQNAEAPMNAVDLLFTKYLKINDAKSISIFMESVSPKFLLMVLNEIVINKGNPGLCLDILFKLLKVKPMVLRNFTKSNGMDLLFDILKTTDMSYYENVICLLYTYALGGCDTISTVSTFEDFKDNNDAFEMKVVMREPFYITVELLEWAVINDIRTPNPCELDELITRFLYRVSLLLKNPENASILDPRVSVLMEKLNGMFITLTKPQNSSIYKNSSNLIADIISGSFLHVLLTLNAYDFEKYLDDATHSVKNELNKAVSELELNSNVCEMTFLNNFFVLVFRKLNGLKFQLESELCNCPFIMSNILTLFNKFKLEILIINFNTSFYLEILENVINCTAILSKIGMNNFKNVTRSAIVDMLTHTIIALLYPVFNKEQSWDPSVMKKFCKLLQDHDKALFDCDTGFCEKGLVQFILSFLLSQLKYDSQLGTVSRCIKAILARRSQDLSSIAESLSVEDSPNLKATLMEGRVSEEDILTIIKSTVLNDVQRDRALDYATKRINLRQGLDTVDQSKLNDRIVTCNLSQLDVSYRQKEKKRGLFSDDNIALEKRIKTIYQKFCTNFVTDMEQDTVVHDNELSFMSFQHSYTLSLQESKAGNCVWELDSVEDFNRMRRRLLPSPQESDDQLFSNPREGGHEIKESKIKTKRWRTNSLLSYDIISDIESIDLSINERKDENRKVLKVLKGKDSIKNVWNCCLVIGLDIREGILIIGNLNVYFISNYYFVKNDNKVIKLSEVAADKRDTNISLITGLSSRNTQQSHTHEVHMWQLSDLIFVTKRPFLLRDVAMELLFENGTNCFVSFDGKQYRDVVYSNFQKLPKNRHIDPVLLSILRELNTRSSSIGSTNGISKASLKSKVFKALSSGSSLIDGFSATSQWQKGEISNFYYLIILNTLAGRTFNDLTQYPVFPWVLSDYSSNDLDLSDPSVYRDFSKPMGAQSKKRELQFIERYEALKSLGDQNSLPFHYGTHYSSAMIVSSYLIRLKPFVDSFLLLQDGKFGHADRLFNSISRAWSSAAIENTTDVRELTPEFFFLPEFLLNVNAYTFGKSQNGKDVNNVILPPWARGDANTFIWRNREALESPYVSQHLHEWIDLIFGFKQRGANAVASVNIFNNLSYPGAVNLDSINDETERRAVTGIIHNFGQTPLQIFQEPHPPKEFTSVHRINRTTWNNMDETPSRVYQAVFGRTTRNSVRYIYWQTNADGSLYWNGYPFLDVMIRINETFLPLRLTSPCSIQIGSRTYDFIHRCKITAFTLWKRSKFITGDESGVIKIWGYFDSGVSNKLSHLGTLYGHLAYLKDMKLYPDYDTLISIDMSGVVYIWDLIKYRLIRRLCSNGVEIAISQNHGSIVVFTAEHRLEVYNFNGSFYTSLGIEKNRAVTRLEFINFSAMDLGRKRHAYWKEKEVFVVGYGDGKLEVYELVLNKNAQWYLKLLKNLTTGKGNEITCLKTQLRIHPFDNGEKNPHDIPKLEIMAGDTNGNLCIWG